MEGTNPSLQDTLIEQQLANLTATPPVSTKWGDQPTASSIWNASTPLQSDRLIDPNRHRFNHYADKQLRHLVVSQQFDFARIAMLLNYIFRDERVRYSECACRERWQQLHSLRQAGAGVRERRMEDKRAVSVSAFSDPYSLYNLEEMLDKLQHTELQTQALQQTGEGGGVGPSGYNIFKDSIRRIDDMEGHIKRKREMMDALSQAQAPEHVITDKLMHFSPYYDRLNEFQVKAEELTEEKMKEIMSLPIEIERMEKELRVKDMNELQDQGKVKRGRREEQMGEERRYEIEEDWDQYESD